MYNKYITVQMFGASTFSLFLQKLKLLL